MFFKRFKTPGLAHCAYLIAGESEAVVVDPCRDVERYLEAARKENLTIKYVLETHRQEDFVVGASELSQLTGAKIVAGDHSLFGRVDIRLKDQEELEIDKLKFLALHTPGHTPESMCYAVFIEDSPQRAWGVFTGDALFIGEAGRTDLTDPDKTAENAGLLYDNVRAKLLPLGDQTLLYPAHGSGSVCGGNIAERDESTIGLERNYNPIFVKTREEFIEGKLKERIPRPPYFSNMEKVNLEGGAQSKTTAKSVRTLQPKKFKTEIGQGIVVDARDPEAFAGGHIPGAYSIWLDGLSVFGGWVAKENTRIFLVLAKDDDLEEAVTSLTRIGLDGVEGYLAGGFEAWRDAGLAIESSGTITPKALSKDLENMTVLDVREISEFEEEGHIKGAHHVFVGHIERLIADLKSAIGTKRPVVTVCSVGHRASLAASILKQHGFSQVLNLLGGMTAWEELHLPMVYGPDPARS